MKKLSIFLCLLGVLLVSCNQNRTVVTKVESIQDNAVLCGGYISDLEFSNAHYGICWSESSNPTLKNGTVVETGFRTNKKGNFTVWIRDLLPEHTYYLRAFYYEGQRITYGSVICVTTKAQYHDNTRIENAVQDFDGNSYNATKLGDQIWMASNLKTTHYADGTEVPSVKYPDGNSDNVDQYGYMYTFRTATRNAHSVESPNPSGVQGICPDGWHLPSLAEWEQLTFYLESHPDQYIKPSGSIAKALASTEGWMASTGYGAPGNDPSTNNSTGFSALPAGIHRTNGPEEFQQMASFSATNTLNFWLDNQYCTASSYASLSNYSSGFFYDMEQSFVANYWIFSVRCVKD